MRSLWISLAYSVPFLHADDRIHEETSCIALYLGVGQLLPSHIYDYLTHLLWSDLLREDGMREERFAQGSVVEMRTEGAMETEGNIGDGILPTQKGLEDAGTISVTALGHIPYLLLSSEQAHPLHTLYDVLDLHTIGTYILHSR